MGVPMSQPVAHGSTVTVSTVLGLSTGIAEVQLEINQDALRHRYGATSFKAFRDLQKLQLCDYDSVDAAAVQVGGPANLISAAVCADLGSQADAESNVTASVSGLVDGVASIGAAMTQLAIPVLTTGSSWAWLFVAFTGMLLTAAFLLVPVMRKEMADQSREEGVSLTQMSE
ncbi:hypothetical protein FOL46_002930 [Perkinsus olseni]|uniref:Uncharacterized protein n=1 Tax=Perkinsus olseni TaxID=32597 RepID=A0A7J6MYD1_PEROL|nr:hypothetical protein FOL46_002930 [Perkinsus olseni]